MIVDDPIIPLGKLGSQFGHRGRDVLASFCHVEEIFRTPGAIGDEALSAEFPTSEPARGAIPANQHVADQRFQPTLKRPALGSVLSEMRDDRAPDLLARVLSICVLHAMLAREPPNPGIADRESESR